MTLNNNSMLFKIFIFSFLLFSQLSFAGSPALEAEVGVSPVGDFTASIEKVTGFAVKEGDKYKAEGIRFSMLDLKTGMKVRDTHSQKYMETDKYPEAVLTKAIGKEGKGSAKIKFHGVEKIVKGDYSVEGAILVAKFMLSLKEFGITDINFKGAGVNDEVKVTVRIPIK